MDTYILSGTGLETWQPSFTRHPTRYIQVSFSPSPPQSFAIAAQVVHNAVASTGQFTCSSALLNTIEDNQRRTVLNNLWGIPTDTPWRDRQGWTADNHLFMDTAVSNFDMERFYLQWIATYRDTQGADGSLPVIAPFAADSGLPLNDPSWSGTFIFDIWALYQQYGNLEFLTGNYLTATRWMDLMASTIAATGYLYDGFSFGDWAAPGSEAGGSTLLAEKIGQAFNATFFNLAAGTYQTSVPAGYRQTSNLVPLYYGLVPAGHEAAVYDNLVADVHARQDHLNTGAVGTAMLLPALTAHGDVDLAYTIATQTTYPSWGYWVSQGATTSWETWSHTGPQQSLDHAFLGTINDWLYHDLAGISATAPGFARILIRPVLPAGLDQVQASMGTVRGVVASSWQRAGDDVELTVQVPAGATAEIDVPVTDGGSVQVSDPGVRYVGTEGGYARYAASSGQHRFISRR